MFGDHPTCPDCGSVRIPVRKGSSKLRCVNGCELLRRARGALSVDDIRAAEAEVEKVAIKGEVRVPIESGSVLDELTQEAERLGMYENAETIAKRAQQHEGLRELTQLSEEAGGYDPEREPDIWEEWPDAEFLDYVEAHSMERLPLFSVAMFRRFKALVGDDELFNFMSRRDTTRLVTMHYEDIQHALKKARACRYCDGEGCDECGPIGC